MGSRYTKNIPEYVYFVGSGEWIQGPYVKPQKGRENIKFKITEVIEEPPITLGVICSKIDDFLEWKEEQGLVPTGIDTKTKFQVDNKIYHCINSITSVRGYMYSGIIETKKGKERKDYEQIIQAAMVAIKNL